MKESSTVESRPATPAEQSYGPLASLPFWFHWVFWFLTLGMAVGLVLPSIIVLSYLLNHLHANFLLHAVTILLAVLIGSFLTALVTYWLFLHADKMRKPE